MNSRRTHDPGSGEGRALNGFVDGHIDGVLTFCVPYPLADILVLVGDPRNLAGRLAVLDELVDGWPVSVMLPFIGNSPRFGSHEKSLGRTNLN